MFGAFDLDKEWPSGIATVNPCLMSVIVYQNDDVVNKTKQDTDRTRSLFFIFFLYFRLFNTVESKQMLPMTGFEPRTSGVRRDRSTK